MDNKLILRDLLDVCSFDVDIFDSEALNDANEHLALYSGNSLGVPEILASKRVVRLYPFGGSLQICIEWN